MLARQWMIDTIRGVYELYGFVPLVDARDRVPGRAARLGRRRRRRSSRSSRSQNPEKEALGLRFDLTVPLARVIAQYRDLPRPFRRYQVAPVWRADKPDKGRFREFTQFDLDSVGVESEIADTEIIAGMCDTLTALKVGALPGALLQPGHPQPAARLRRHPGRSGRPTSSACSTSSTRSASRRSAWS